MKEIPLTITTFDPDPQLIPLICGAFSPKASFLGISATAHLRGEEMILQNWQIIARGHSSAGVIYRDPLHVAQDIVRKTDASCRAITALAGLVNLGTVPISRAIDIPWHTSSEERGFDLREVFFFPNVILIADTVHDRTGYGPDDHSCANAILVPAGLSSHAYMSLREPLKLCARLLTVALPDDLAGSHVFAMPEFQRDPAS